MYPVIVTQMKKMLINQRHYWQEDFIEEKADIKVSYLSFVSIAMKFLILQQDAQKKIYKEGSKYKNRKEDDGKDYRDKGKKSCYIVDEQDSDENDGEVVYVGMKEI